MSFRNRAGLYGGIPEVRQFASPEMVDPRMASTSEESASGGPNWRYGGLVTYEKPITEWYGDILVPVNAAGSVTFFRSGVELPNNCVGFRIIGVIGTVQVAINGQGNRTVINGDVYSGTEIQSIMVTTDATGTCIIQAAGTGD